MRFKSMLVCAGMAPLLLAATEPLRLQPAGPWDVDYAENSCRLLRTFGDGKTLVKFGLESAAPGEMDMLVAGKPLQTSAEEVGARFLPVGTKTFDGMVVKTVGSGDPAIIWSNVPMLPEQTLARLKKEGEEHRRNPGVRPPPTSLAEQADRLAQRQQFATTITELEIQTTHQRSVTLETGSLGAAIAAFDKCSRDSLKDWGVDPALEDRIVRPVWGANPQNWLSSADYPNNMLMNGKESDVTLRLLVDATGQITKCTSLSHFADEEFNRISCSKVTQRARFEPAELEDGTKVPSYYTFRIHFRIAR
jgi:TonB family protein